jgi:dTDP-4-amino-4,6-dideoxygalactose transaminase
MPMLLPVGANKMGFMESMKARSIQTSFHYPPIHTFTAYARGKDTISLPITEAVAEREVTLPLYPTLRDEDILVVVQAVADVLGHS